MGEKKKQRLIEETFSADGPVSSQKVKNYVLGVDKIPRFHPSNSYFLVFSLSNERSYYWQKVRYSKDFEKRKKKKRNSQTSKSWRERKPRNHGQGAKQLALPTVLKWLLSSCPCWVTGNTLVVLLHEIIHPTGLGYAIYHRFVSQKWNICEKKLQTRLREISRSTWKITNMVITCPHMPGPSTLSSFVQWFFAKHWGTICLMSLRGPNP